MFVFTGILPIAHDEDGLAAVLGHEIAHVVAHHTAERISSRFIFNALVVAIAYAFDVSGQLPSLMLNVLYSLPNSRTQEVCHNTLIAHILDECSPLNSHFTRQKRIGSVSVCCMINCD